jgi:hypothetical protein
VTTITKRHAAKLVAQGLCFVNIRRATRKARETYGVCPSFLSRCPAQPCGECRESEPAQVDTNSRGKGCDDFREMGGIAAQSGWKRPRWTT